MRKLNMDTKVKLLCSRNESNLESMFGLKSSSYTSTSNTYIMSFCKSSEKRSEKLLFMSGKKTGLE